MEHKQDVQDCIDCGCDDCVQALADFNAWCDQTEARWGWRCLPFDRCGNVLCPRCGDPRDTSIIPAAVRA